MFLRELIREELGLTPDVIREYHKEFKEVEKAEEMPGDIPRPVTRTITIDLSPGAPQPIVRVYDKNGCTVIFTDITGAPWPVLLKDNFAKENFEVNIPVTDGPSLTISAKKTFGHGNMAVFLKELAAPLNIVMVSGQKETDQRINMVIPKKGPLAKEEKGVIVEIPLFNPNLQKFLDDLPPPSAKKIKPTINDQETNIVKTWIFDDKLYIRSSLDLFIPTAIHGKTSSLDGTCVYSVDITPIVRMTDENGNMYTVKMDIGD